jgi:hypothetical protein
MKKAVIGAVAAIAAIAPTPLLVASWEVAHAEPHTVVTTPARPTAPQQAHEAPPVQHAPPVHQAPPTHEAPPVTRPHEAPSVVREPSVTQAPPHTAHPPITREPHVPNQAPINTPVQTPKVTPPAITGPTKVAGGTSPGAVIPPTGVRPVPPHVTGPMPTERPGSGTSLGPTGGLPRRSTPASIAHVAPPPKGVPAPPEAIEAAKKAPPVVIEPGSPPPPPIQVNFNLQVENVITINNTNIDVVNVDNQVMVLPRHWDYVDYDDYHRPILYNPINEALTFRYFYDGDYREVYIPAGGRIVLNITIIGLFSFTAVGQDYITVGSFSGGAWIPPPDWDGPPPDSWAPPPPPQVCQDVTVVSADVDTSVQVNTVTVVGHDDSRPVGQQDTLMLNDSTLAWGQVQDGGCGETVQIAKVQTLPGVGPVCDGGQWMNTALESSTHHGGISRLKWVLGGGLAVTVLVGGGVTWMIRRWRGLHV